MTTNTSPARQPAAVAIGPALDIPDPEIKRKGDEYTAYWGDYLTQMRFSHIHEKDHTLRAELTVHLFIEGAPSPAEWTTLDLASSQSRAVIANRLREQWEGPAAPPYREMLAQAAYKIREIHRTGQPIERIGGARRPIRETRYALYPILPEGQISILYGDGASLKSMIAQAIALSVQDCLQIVPGTRVGQTEQMSRTGPTLYLDFETNADEQHARIRRIAAGFRMEGYREVAYRECHTSIPKDIATLRGLVDEYDSRLVVVDSLGAAIGADPNDAATTIATMSALRSLRTTVLCIDHVTKTDDQGKPFGSAYKFNYARAAFHAKRVQETDSDVVNVALIHKKANNGRLVAPLGFSVRFSPEDNGPITIKHLDVRDDVELAQYASAPSRIKHALGRGPLDATAIKEAVGEMNAETLRKALKRLRDNGEIIVMQGQRYALNAERR